MVNKQIDSVTMPKWVAVAVLGAVLTFGVQSWWARSADHDALVEMKTELKATREAKEREESRRDQAAADMQAWREVMNGNLKEIKGMLNQQQVDALDRIKKSGSTQQ